MDFKKEFEKQFELHREEIDEIFERPSNEISSSKRHLKDMERITLDMMANVLEKYHQEMFNYLSDWHFKAHTPKKML